MTISIHALRGEGDIQYPLLIARKSIISIHALRGEGDIGLALKMALAEVISIHALRGEGDDSYDIFDAWLNISIHALRGEGDIKPARNNRHLLTFQSTPSVGRATL